MQHINEAVTSAWEAAWDRGDVDALDAVLHPDYVRESTGSHHITDAQQFKQDILDVRSAFPDLVTSIDSLIVSEDAATAAIFWHSSGTFSGELQGVPATGRRVQTRGSNLVTLRDGLIVHEQVTWDQTELFADLGLPSLRSAFEVDPGEIVVDRPGAPPPSTCSRASTANSSRASPW